MTTVASQISKNIGSALTIANIWGSVIFNVKDTVYGAKGDGTTYDSAAIQSAINAAAVLGGIVLFPPGTYCLNTVITVPSNVILQGSGNASTLFAPITIDKMVSLKGRMRDLKMNGNNKASKCISMDADFCFIENVYWQYATYGLYGNGTDVHRIVGCSSDNCTYSIYSANRFINIVIDDCISNVDGYFLYCTYTDQQPQGIRVKDCLVFGALQGAIKFEKDAYEIIIEGNMFDGITGNVITLPEGPNSSQYKITDNFIASANSDSASGFVNIFVGAGTQGVFIEKNTITLAPQWGVYMPSTASKRSSNIHIEANTFNDNNRGGGTGDILIDSTDNTRIISNNFATLTGNSVVTTATFSPTFTVKMVYNGFATTPNLPSGQVVTRDSVSGYITNNEGVGTMAAGLTSSTISHGLSVAPTKVFITSKGNIGSSWVTNPTFTQFTVNCSTAPGSDVEFSWSAEK